MAKILFAWELGGGLGHCVKLAPIAAGLIARGHTVYFAARDIATAHRMGGGLPIIYLPAPWLTARPRKPVREVRSFAHILHNTGFGDDDHLTALVASWRNLLDLVQPAAILCEHAPIALLAARWQNCPRMSMGTGFSLPPDVSPFPELRPSSSERPDLSNHEQKILDRVNSLLASDNLRPLNRLSQLYADVQGSFLMTFRELDHHRRESAEYRGMWSPAGGALPEWPHGSGPKIFAYLKPTTPPWHLEPVLSLLSELKARTIACVPDADPSILKLQTPALRVSPARLDVSVLAGQSDLAVLHGTAGATTQFLLAGVPLLTIPLHLEQAIMGQRVAELGAGLAADPRRVEQVAVRLWSMLETTQFRQSAQTLAARYANYEAAAQQDRIVDEIDQRLRG